MTLKDNLQQSLAALPLFSSGEQSLDLSENNQHLTCQLTALDTLACAFNRLSLRADSLMNRSPDQLKKIAENLSAKLTYLLEPISPIETDFRGLRRTDAFESTAEGCRSHQLLRITGRPGRRVEPGSLLASRRSATRSHCCPCHSRSTLPTGRRFVRGGWLSAD